MVFVDKIISHNVKSHKSTLLFFEKLNDILISHEVDTVAVRVFDENNCTENIYK